MIAQKIQQIFQKTPEIQYGYADISYSPFSDEYQSALVFAVPHERLLTLDCYSEELFEECILEAKEKVGDVLKDIEAALKDEGIKYYIVPVAQENEEDLLAQFSFKYAAVNAGLGWIGKNDVLITQRYGPRVRLSAVLIDYSFEAGEVVTKSKCGSCNRCVEICPHKALTGADWDIHAQRSDLIDYHLCNQKRSAYIEKHGRKHACGLCMVVCPYGIM